MLGSFRGVFFRYVGAENPIRRWFTIWVMLACLGHVPCLTALSMPAAQNVIASLSADANRWHIVSKLATPADFIVSIQIRLQLHSCNKANRQRNGWVVDSFIN